MESTQHSTQHTAGTQSMMMIIDIFLPPSASRIYFFKNKHFFFFTILFFFFFLLQHEKAGRGQGWEGNTQVCELRTYLTLRQSFLSLALFKKTKSISIAFNLPLTHTLPLPLQSTRSYFFLPTAPFLDQNNVLLTPQEFLRIQ